MKTTEDHVTVLDDFAYETTSGAVAALGLIRDLDTVDSDQLADALARLLLVRLHITVPAETILTVLPALIEDARLATQAVTR